MSDTFKAIVANAVATLNAKEFNSAKEDVRRLVDFLNVDGVKNYNSNDTVSEKISKGLNKLINRRLKNEPISHLIGYRWFWENKFIVNRNVLDPRPETECLVGEALSLIKKQTKILDLGTGSGCIGISIALSSPLADVKGCDISLKALRVAKRNAKILGANFNVFRSNWFSNVRESFDLIISNPPYISSDEMLNLSEEVKNFEPLIALTDGSDGFQSFVIIAASLSKYLNPGGVGIFECGHSQAPYVKNIFEIAGFFNNRFVKDLDGRDRAVCVIKDA